MDTDLILVIGLVLAALTFSSIVSAFSRGTPPRAAAVVAVIGGAMIVYAVTTHPGGYRFQDVPGVIARVIDRYIN